MDRRKREQVIKMIGEGTEVKREIVDKGHKNGAEAPTELIQIARKHQKMNYNRAQRE